MVEMCMFGKPEILTAISNFDCHSYPILVGEKKRPPIALNKGVQTYQ